MAAETQVDTGAPDDAQTREQGALHPQLEAARPDPNAVLALPVAGELAWVQGDVKLHIAPDISSRAVRLYDASQALPGETWIFAARVVAMTDEWVEIETLDTDTIEMQCEQVPWNMGQYKLRLFVELRHIIPVVREQIDVKDGAASWRVGVGEPLAFGPSGLTFQERPFGIKEHPIQFPDENVGRSYPRARRWGKGARRISNAVGLNRLPVDYTWDHPTSAENVIMVKRQRNGWSLITLRHRCTTLTIKVPSRAIMAAGSIGMGGGRPPGPYRYRIAAGTEVVWDSGEHAGVMLEPMVYPDAVSSPSATLKCFDVPLGWRVPDDEGILRLCHDVNSLEPVIAPE